MIDKRPDGQVDKDSVYTHVSVTNMRLKGFYMAAVFV